MTKDHFAIQPPFTGFNPEQLEVLAELSETYADGTLRISTSRDLTLEMIALDDFPSLLRRLGAVGLNLSIARIMQLSINGQRASITTLGCGEEARRYARAQDLGFIAKIGDYQERGFEVWSANHLLFDFIREDELSTIVRSIVRVTKRSRVRSALKNLGLEGLRASIAEKRARTTAKKRALSFERWAETNVRRQKQLGYATVTVVLPGGELLGAQLRGLAQVARRFSGNNVKTTIDQNFLLRFIRQNELRAVYDALDELQLADYSAETTRLLRVRVGVPPQSEQAYADITFRDVERGRFQVVLGGSMSKNAAKYGLAIGAVPAKSIPRVVGRLASKYVLERAENETFADFIARVGDKQVKAMLDDVWLAL